MANATLAHSRDYRRSAARDGLINEVLSAVRQYLGRKTIGQQQSVDSGWVDGFIDALKEHDDRIRSIIERHGLFFAAMAAISLASEDDSPHSLLALICQAQIWSQERKSEQQSTNAAQPRSPFVALTKQLIRNHPTATAKELWNRLIDTGQQVELGYASYSIDVTDSDGYLCWGAERNDIDDNEPLSGRVGWQRFPSFISKCRAS